MLAECRTRCADLKLQVDGACRHSSKLIGTYTNTYTYTNTKADTNANADSHAHTNTKESKYNIQVPHLYL